MLIDSTKSQEAVEYPYIYDENRDMYPIKRFMDIYSFENKIISMGNKWYFGLDQNNIERVVYIRQLFFIFLEVWEFF